MPDKQPESHPDRPLECTECKRSIAVIYTEIVGDTITRTSMCAECPELQRRLKGVPTKSGIAAHDKEGAGLACGNCGTTLEAIRKGANFGCIECYEVFGDVLVSELLATHKIAARVVNAKKSMPIHIGRAPGESKEINPSLRILALNEALNETLSREDYEQAAWLRDQIKALTENKAIPDKKEKNAKVEKKNDRKSEFFSVVMPESTLGQQ